jgi:hypothetical protein
MDGSQPPWPRKPSLVCWSARADGETCSALKNAIRAANELGGTACARNAWSR